MNLENIFGLFGFNENNENTKKQIENEIDDFKNNPHYKIRMFIKLINNGVIFKDQIIDFFSKSDASLDISNINEAGDFMMYARAWYWIEQCDLNNEDWKYCLSNIPHKKFFDCIDLCNSYYEMCEEYEKCAHLRNIKNFCKKRGI